MSYLGKLYIQGIRSFGPEDNHRGILKFQSPLTIILGENGCGKTTIIECLRYCATGEFPPNCKTGVSFLHDVDRQNGRSVMSKVAMEFTSISGKTVTCTRTARVDRNMKKLTFKSLEQMMTFRNKGENKETDIIERINNKVVDVNEEMSTQFGVSKALLTHVIFCHQEDSNWPLGDSKTLKERFDAIFDATKYTQLIVELNNQKKTMKQEEQEEQVSLEQLKIHARNGKELEEQSQRMKCERAELMTQKDVLHKEQTETESKLDSVDQKLRKAERKQKEIDQLRERVCGKKEEQSRLESLVKHIANFVGSRKDLEQNIAQFDQNDVTLNQLDRLDEELNETKHKCKENKDEEQKLHIDLDRLEQKQKNLEDMLHGRDSNMTIVAGEYNISGFPGGEYSLQKYRQFQEKMQAVKQAKYDYIAKLKSRMSIEEDRNRDAENKMSNEINQVSFKVEAKKQEMDTQKIRVSEIGDLLSEAKNSQNRLSSISTEINVAEKSIKGHKQNYNPKKLTESIERLKSDRKNLTQQEIDLNIEWQESNKQCGLQQQIKLHNDNRDNKQTQRDEIIQQHKSNIAKVIAVPRSQLQQTNSSNWQKQLIQRNEILRERKKDLMEDLREEEANLVNKTVALSDVKRDFKERESQREEYEKEMKRLVPCGDIDEYRTELQTSLTQLTSKESTVVLHWFKKLLKKKKKACCPLCERDFDSAKQAENAAKKLEINAASEDTTKAKSEILRLEREIESLVILKDKKEKIEDGQIEIDRLGRQKSKLESQIEKLQDEIKQKRKEEENVQKEEEDLRKVEAPVARINSLTEEIEHISKQIESLEKSKSADIRDIEDIEQERQKVMKNKRSVEEELEEAQENLQTHNSELTRLEQLVNNLTTEQLAIQKTNQNESTLVEEKQTLEDSIREARHEIEDMQNKLQPMQMELKQLKDKHTQMKEKANEKFENEKEQSQKLELKLNEMKNGETKWIELEKSDIPQKISELKREIEDLRKKIKDANFEVEKLEGNKKDLEDKRNHAINKKRQLKDQLELMLSKEAVEDLKKRLSELENDGESDVEAINQTRTNISQKLAYKLQQIGKLQGRLDEINRNVVDIGCKLVRKEYMNVAERHRNALVNWGTTKATMRDLDVYKQALEQAIIKFHQDKMKQLNTHLEDLWTSVYKGEDITSIKIVSETDVTTANKKYNYRVVKVEGDVEKEMRGQCSAGQKILASLLIRMSLAEVFCCGCGVLTLDEPTTNLDSNNVHALAGALNDLVMNRRQQDNFQLVVITHEKEFVKQLVDRCDIEYYYKIEKDEQGCSQINMNTRRDLF